MAKMIRAFIAIELSSDLKEIMLEVGHELASRIPDRTVRWVKPAAMHLTLVFLGDTPSDKLDTITQGMTVAAAGIPPVTITVTGLGCFPNTRRPRVVWVGVEETTGSLRQLKRALDRELEPLGFTSEKRRFSPHLTLGRVHKRADRGDIQRLGKVVESATLKDAGQMTARKVHLIRSDLRPDGPIYTILASAPLSGDIV
jgi:2'-5' RNA ligase